MSTKLTPNFTLEELTRSSTAERLGMPNWPEADDLRRLRGTAEMLQRLARHFFMQGLQQGRQRNL